MSLDTHFAQCVGNDRWSVTLATAHRAGLALRQEQAAPESDPAADDDDSEGTAGVVAPA